MDTAASQEGAHPVGVDDFIRQVSKRTGLTDEDARAGTRAVLAAMREVLSAEDYRHLIGQLPAGVHRAGGGSQLIGHLSQVGLARPTCRAERPIGCRPGEADAAGKRVVLDQPQRAQWQPGRREHAVWPL